MDWVEQLQKVSVPCGPINNLADVFSDPQLLSRDMYLEMAHPTLGKIKQTGIPVKFSRTPGGLDRHPVALGNQFVNLIVEIWEGGTHLGHVPSKSVPAADRYAQ